MGRAISEDIQRRLFAESMGRCMNPDCKKELFFDNGDIIEKAHIIGNFFAQNVFIYVCRKLKK